MAMTCRTSDGDVLDVLCFSHYGHLVGVVEAVLEENPGLAAEAQPFRAGLVIRFPDVSLAAAEADQIQLWE